MPGNFNGDDIITSLTQKQIKILKKKYGYELIRIGLFDMFGNQECAECLAKKILTEEGLL